MVSKNNLRIILGSKSEKFKNNEAQKKFGYSYIEFIVFLFVNVHNYE